MGTLTGPDTATVEAELAAVTGRMEAAAGDRQEQLDGARAALAWRLGREESPVTLTATAPTHEALVDEFAAAGTASLDPRSPAYRYARGAHEALLWLLGQGEPVTRP
jgi:Ser/Thr protein kinase RdoA (MazF antagonist)